MKIADTVEEGDEIGGFRVIHFPGHAPGLIALWRERDRLALVSDTIYLVDSMRLRRADHPSVPVHVFNLDHAAAIASVRKLAALEPADRVDRPRGGARRRAAPAPRDPRASRGRRVGSTGLGRLGLPAGAEDLVRAREALQLHVSPRLE